MGNKARGGDRRQRRRRPARPGPAHAGVSAPAERQQPILPASPAAPAFREERPPVAGAASAQRAGRRLAGPPPSRACRARRPRARRSGALGAPHGAGPWRPFLPDLRVRPRRSFRWDGPLVREPAVAGAAVARGQVRPGRVGVSLAPVPGALPHTRLRTARPAQAPGSRAGAGALSGEGRRTRCGLAARGPCRKPAPRASRGDRWSGLMRGSRARRPVERRPAEVLSQGRGEPGAEEDVKPGIAGVSDRSHGRHRVRPALHLHLHRTQGAGARWAGLRREGGAMHLPAGGARRAGG